MSIDLTPIFQALIALAAALVSTFLIPWLVKKYGTEKLNEVQRWVGIFVRAAEQIYNESGLGEQKKAYVLARLEEKGYIIDMDEIDGMIEATVLEINREAALLKEAA